VVRAPGPDDAVAVAAGPGGGQGQPGVWFATAGRSWRAERKDEIDAAISPASLIVMHGAAGTLNLLARLGITVGWDRVVDTETTARLHWPRGVPQRRGRQLFADHSLDSLVKRLTGIAITEDRRAVAIWGLWEVLRPQLTSAEWRLLAREMRLAAVLAGIESRGLLVDVARTASLLRKIGARRSLLATALGSLGFSANFAAAADRDRLSRLLRQRGIPVPSREDGQLGTRDADLQRIAAADPDITCLIEAIIECRRLGQQAKCYLQPLLDLRDIHDRVHPEIDALAARTGRMSISKPPLQEFPTSGGFRECLLAGPGRVLVAADLQQIEFRVAAALSADDAMRRAILAGTDLHAVTAARLYGPGFTAAQRSLAKRAGFARLYGGGIDAVTDGCGVTREVAQGVLAAFDAEYPGIQRYAKELASHEVHVLPSGRRVATDPGRPHTPVNYVIQGAARDLFADTLLRIADAGLASRLWLVVHDEVILSVPGAEAAADARQLNDLMTCDFLGIPVTADVKVLGARWGHAELAGEPFAPLMAKPATSTTPLHEVAPELGKSRVQSCVQ
jgi:DNA polymerase I